MSTKQDKAKVSNALSAVLGSSVSREVIDQWPEVLDQMAEGDRITNLDVLVHKLMKLALDPSKANQWAIDMIVSYTEGKPTQAEKPDPHRRRIAERLNDITVSNINNLAQQAIKRKPDPAEGAAGPAAKLLDLPHRGRHGAEGD